MPRDKRPSAGLFRPIPEASDNSPIDLDQVLLETSRSTPSTSPIASSGSSAPFSRSSSALSGASSPFSRSSSALSGRRSGLRRSDSSSGFVTYTYALSKHHRAHQMVIQPGLEHFGSAVSIAEKDWAIHAKNRRHLLKDLYNDIKAGATRTIHAGRVGKPTTKDTPTVKIVITDRFADNLTDVARSTALSFTAGFNMVSNNTVDSAIDILSDAAAPIAHRLFRKAKSIDTSNPDALYEQQIKQTLNSLWRQDRLKNKAVLCTLKTHVSPSEAAHRQVYDTGKHCINVEAELLHVFSYMLSHGGRLPADGSLTDIHQATIQRVITGETTVIPASSREEASDEAREAPTRRATVTNV